MNFFSKVFAVLLLIFAHNEIFAQTADLHKLPVGTIISLKMDTEINSASFSVGDTFTTTVAKPVLARNFVVMPQDIMVEGRITKIARSGYGGKNGSLEVKFEAVQFPGDVRRSLHAVPVKDFRPRSALSENILTFTGISVAGAVIGALTKRSKGMLAGTLIGAGTGISVVLGKKGKDVRIETGQVFDVRLVNELSLPVTDY